jgi:hypothetical protein
MVKKIILRQINKSKIVFRAKNKMNSPNKISEITLLSIALSALL